MGLAGPPRRRWARPTLANSDFGQGLVLLWPISTLASPTLASSTLANSTLASSTLANSTLANSTLANELWPMRLLCVCVCVGVCGVVVWCGCVWGVCVCGVCVFV